MGDLTVSVVFGTRPEAIKLAPVILALQRETDLRCNVCVVGQHRQMLDQVLEVFDLRPDHDLDLMRPNQSLAAFTARAISSLDTYFAAAAPDLVLVQGDTTTAICAAMTAFYHKVPVGHVEAGLRTRNLLSPWPEEANRVLISRLAALHFAPTEVSRRNLLHEAVPPERILVTGNTLIDALFLAVDKIRTAPPAVPGLPADWRERWADDDIVLITGHRRESFGGGFENICQAIADLAVRFPKARFVYPVHLNPNVREPVQRILQPAHDRTGNIHLIEPLPYLAFVALFERSTLVLTDSGGIQEEAPSLAKPVLVMRDTTERPEAVTAGTAKLVGTAREAIVHEAATLLTDAQAYRRMARTHNPFGDGRAAMRIVEACRAFLTGAPDCGETADLQRAVG